MAILAEVNARLQQMQDLGVENVRLLVPWAGVQPVDPALGSPAGDPNWGALDLIVNAAHDKGMGILGVLNSTPWWATESTPINGQPADFNEFADFAKQVALRYGEKIGAYEVWRYRRRVRARLASDDFPSGRPDGAAHEVHALPPRPERARQPPRCTTTESITCARPSTSRAKRSPRRRLAWIPKTRSGRSSPTASSAS